MLPILKRAFLYFVSLYSFCFLYASVTNTEDRLEYFMKANESFNNKNYGEAIKSFRRFLKEQPYLYEVRDALFYLAESYLQEKNYLNAASNFATLLNKYPTSKYRTSGLFKVGQCYYQLKITTRAKINLEKYLKKVKAINLKNGYHANANFYLGFLYKKNRNYKQALKYFKASLNLFEKSVKKYGIDEKVKNQLEVIYYEIGMLYAKHFKSKKIAFYYLKKYIKSKKNIPRSLKFTMRGLSLSHLDKVDGLPGRSISDIKVDGDDIWISTWGSGLVRFSRSSEKFEKIPLPSSQIRNLYIDFNTVYICTYDGIFIYSKRSGKTTSLIDGKQKSFVIAQKVIKDDRYFYFTTLSKGVVRYDSIKHQVTIFGRKSLLGSNQVYAITADHRYLIFGTLDAGLIIYNKKNQKVTYLNEKHLDGNNIKSILIDGRFLWIGVYQHGIYKYDLIQKKIYKMNWGVTYPSLITKRESEIWVGSSGDGIYVYNQQTEKLEKIRAIEGLASNEIHLIEVEADYIWIGYLDSGVDLLYRPLVQ